MPIEQHVALILGKNMSSKRLSKNALKRYTFGYALVAPAFIILVVFFVWPLIQGLKISFYSGLGVRGVFVGSQNYTGTLTDPRFWNSFRVSMIFTFSIVVFSGLFGLLLAIALLKKPRMYVLYIAAAFMPYITTPVIGALIWNNLLADPFGIINVVLTSLGFQSVPWLKTPVLALISIIFIQVWYTIGYNAVLFMAGLQAIPTSYYEAAEIEGCGFFHKLVYITIPLLIPTIIFVAVISTLYGFVNSYILAELVTGGGPFEATNVMLSYVFEYAFDRFDLGRANAVTMITFVLFTGLAFIQFNYQKKKFFGLY